jgi:CRISPR/Cas system CSM-associated protein Csm3 (group 7 of RAMP superfamily)
LSDSAFGRGDGVAGLVDSEVEHDPRTGLPLIKGRTLKGLLVESCADLLYSLSLCGSPAYQASEGAALDLFGEPGSTTEAQGNLHVGTATLPADLIQQVQQSGYAPAEVLAALTTIRQQTAVDRTTETPLENSLRATRVVLRDTVFYAPLHFRLEPTDVEAALLAACVSTTRRGGLNRSRGLGYIEASLVDTDFEGHLHAFATLVKGVAA